MMNVTKRTTLKKVITVSGSFMCLLPIGVQYYWGNMATYVLSYIHEKQPSVKATQSSWVISIFMVFRILIFAGSGYLIHILGKRVTLASGIFLFNVGLLSCYYSVDLSPAAVNISLGVLCGIGAGAVYGMSLEYAVLWADEKVGVIVSIVESGYSSGAILINQLISFYINPHNETPNYDHGDFLYFSQISVLRNVPLCFVIIAICSLVLQIIAFFMMRDRVIQSDQQIVAQDRRDSNCPYEEDRQTTQLPIDATSFAKDTPESQSSNWSAKNVLRTRSFYILFTSYFFGIYPFLILTNYYKTFGQLNIKNDHFLATLGTCFTITVVISKLALGTTADIRGFKFAIAIQLSLMSFAISFLYLVPKVNKWLYSIDVLLLASSTGSLFAVFTVGVVKIFGRRFAVANTGVCTSSAIIMLLIAPPLMEFLINTKGWPGLFYTGAAASILNLILILFSLPEV